MKRIICRILNITTDEFTPVALLLALGFFIGLFLATIAVASTTLFLNSYSETVDLPVALLISGAFSIIFTGLYSFFQGRISHNLLSIATLLIFIVITSCIEFGTQWFENDPRLYYFAFTLILPFTFVSRLIFWNAFNQLFDLHQARRIVGTIDMGMDVASLIAFFAIPIMLNVGINIISIFSLSLVSVIGFLIVYLILSLSFLKKRATSVLKMQQLPIKKFLNDKYILSISLFIILSTIAIRFVDYSFFNATVSQFDSSDLPYFLSYFEATIVVFSFFVTLFLTDRINREYGIRVSLIINPLLLFIFMTSALLLGHFMGYDPKLSNTTYLFFIMTAMGKLFIDSMKEAIDEPTLKFYYIPFDKSVKNDIHTKLEGVVMGFASLLAGGMIVLINRFKLFDLLTIILFIIAIIAVWYLVIKYMHNNYRVALTASLEKNKSSDQKDVCTTKEYTIDNVFKEKINENADKKIIYSLKLMEKLDPLLFEQAILKLTNTPSSSIRVKRYVDDTIQKFGVGDNNNDDLLKNLAGKAAQEAEDSELLSIPADRIIELGKSVKQSDRIFTAKLLRKLTDNRTIFTLLELLRDSDPKVREAAIITAGRVKRPETWNILIEMLNSPAHSNHVTSVLKKIGDPVLENLNSAFYKTGQPDLVMQKIITIMGVIGGRKAVSFIWQKVDYPNANIINQILQSLAIMKYKAQGQKVSIIKHLLDVEMSKMLWNLVALGEVPNRDKFTVLKKALEEEVPDNYEQIILMLSMLYDRSSIQLVKKNIDSQSSDGSAYAIELLNLFMDADTKLKLIPLLEDSAPREKADKLKLYFPRKEYTFHTLINNILNRNSNYSNRWTKLCALQAITHIPSFQPSQVLIAQMFSEDNIIQETAAWILYNKHPKIYEEVLERLPYIESKPLDVRITTHQANIELEEGDLLKIEMVTLLKKLSIFKSTKGRLICDLVDRIEQIELQRGKKKHLEQHENPIIIIARGNVKLTHEDQTITTLHKEDVLGDPLQNKTFPKVIAIEAQENALILFVQAHNFYFTLANHFELAHSLIENDNVTSSTN